MLISSLAKLPRSQGDTGLQPWANNRRLPHMNLAVHNGICAEYDLIIGFLLIRSITSRRFLELFAHRHP